MSTLSRHAQAIRCEASTPCPEPVGSARCRMRTRYSLLPPLTTRSTNGRWASGDTFALGILAEAPGLGIPVVVLPFVNAALAASPSFDSSVERLRGLGVRVLLGPGEWEPPSGHRRFPDRHVSLGFGARPGRGVGQYPNGGKQSDHAASPLAGSRYAGSRRRFSISRTAPRRSGSVACVASCTMDPGG
jgi:hypothetical protein